MQTKIFNKATWLKTALCTSILLLSLGVSNALGGTYTYYLNSAAGTTGGSNVNYWYTDDNCTTHCQTSNSYTISTSTIYYKYSTEAATSFTLAAANSAYFTNLNNSTTAALLIGKTNSTMTLPTYSGEKITNVTITTSSGTSENVTFSVYSSTNRADGTNADKTAVKSTAFSFDIASTYQTTNLIVKVTNNYNLQISQITITTQTASSKTDLSLSLSYTSTSLTACGSESSSPTLTGNSGNGDVSWGSSNEAVATVSNTGVVTPVAAGNARITATVAETTNYNSGSVYQDFSVSAASARAVTWYVEGVALGTGHGGSESVVPGNQATPPSDPSSSCSGEFVGWVAYGDAVIGNKPSDENTTAPSTIYTTSNKPTITCDGPVAFYAVFKKQ